MLQTKKDIKNFIASRCGLYFQDHDLSNFDSVLTQRLEDSGINSLDDYYTYLISSSKQSEDEIRELINLLTINHTFFFS